MESGFRLTASGPSRAMMVVSFVQQFYARWGEGPSYGQIAAALSTPTFTFTKDAARHVVERAERRGLVMRPGAGRRGVTPVDKPPRPLPSPQDVAGILAALRDAGVRIVAAEVDGERTFRPLPLAPVLDHIPDGDDGDEQYGRNDACREGGATWDHTPGTPEGPRRAA